MAPGSLPLPKGFRSYRLYKRAVIRNYCKKCWWISRLRKIFGIVSTIVARGFMDTDKFLSAEDALNNVHDGDTVAVSGFNRAIAPEYLLYELYRKYLETGHPKNLFFEFETTPGIPGTGIDKIATDIYQKNDTGFIKGMLIPFTGFSPMSAKLIMENKIEGYMWPIGTVSYWFREISCFRPGLLTKVGLDIFTDPRDPIFHGGLMNELALKNRRANVMLMEIDGEEYLMYRAPKPDVALIRGTTADEIGDLSVDEEGMVSSILNIAQAAKARPKRGVVIAQVKRLTKFGSRSPKLIEVPGPLVDYIVKAPVGEQWQSGTYEFNPAIVGEDFIPDAEEIIKESTKNMKPIEEVIARRVTLELYGIIKQRMKNIVINLGIGIPVHVSAIINREKLGEIITTTVEPGPWGGVALSGNDFGVSLSPYAIVPMADQFANYEGGIIDAASLGFMQVDHAGNVNASYLPGKLLTGPGGFPVIARGSPNVYFAGKFTAGKADVVVENGKVIIKKDGDLVKFVDKIQMKVFSAREAEKQGQNVLYITERAVFGIKNSTLELREIAPGIDLDRDILDKMEFKPIISGDLREMDSIVFDVGKKMGFIMQTATR